MTIKKATFIFALLLTLTLMTGCSGSSAQLLTGTSWPSAVESDGIAYISYGSQLFAVEPGDLGADVLWEFPLEPDQNIAIYAKPAIEGETLVVGDYYGTVWALNTITGREEWSLDTGDGKFIGGPSIMDGVVYIANADGFVKSLDLETGAENWTFSAEKGIWGTPLATPDGIFVTSLDAHLYALDPMTGELLWKFPEEGQTVNPVVSAMIGEPVIYDDFMIFSSFNNHIYAINKDTQEILWTYETENWMWGFPVYDSETGYLVGADLDGSIFALELTTGEEAWKTEASGRIVASPVFAELEGEKVLLITSDIERADKNFMVLRIENGTPATASISVMSEFTTRFLFVQTGVDSRPIPLLAEPVVVGDMILLTGNVGDLPMIFLDSQTLRIEYKCNPATGICAS